MQFAKEMFCTAKPLPSFYSLLHLRSKAIHNQKIMKLKHSFWALTFQVTKLTKLFRQIINVFYSSSLSSDHKRGLFIRELLIDHDLKSFPENLNFLVTPCETYFKDRILKLKEKWNYHWHFTLNIDPEVRRSLFSVFVKCWTHLYQVWPVSRDWGRCERWVSGPRSMVWKRACAPLGSSPAAGSNR